jgi:hypothetical protein
MELAATGRITTGKHLATVLFGLWLIGGVFIDGFAHNHGVVETFFTPWHAILYSGFLASAAWMVWLVYREKRKTGSTWSLSIPEGYGLGLTGVAVFLLGGVGDMIWHIIFGIEEDLDALLSPTHLMLLVGALLILSSPYRAAWNNREVTKPGWKFFVPPFLSVVFSAGAVAFFLMYAWMFRVNIPARSSTDFFATEVPWVHISAFNEERGLAYILLTTLIFMFPVFMLMKRWIVPFGTVTLLFTILMVLMNVLDGFQNYPTIIIGAAAGLIADFLYRLVKPGLRKVMALRVVAVAAPTALWALYYLGMYFIDGIGWSTELWTGSVVEAALISLALSLLALSPDKG